MPEKPQQPSEYDAVLGGTAVAPSSGVVLGGLDGVRSRLASTSVEVRVSAVKDALNYGETGIDLVIQALENSSEEVQDCAYLLLKERTEPKIQQVLKQINPWKFLTCIYTLNGHSESVCSLAISPDRETVISGSWDKTIKVWNIKTGTLLRTLNGGYANTLDVQMKVWKIKTGTLLHTLEGHSDQINSVAISPDGQTLISGSRDQTIKVWDINTGRWPRTTMKGHSSWIRSLAISSDGQTLISGSEDRTINVWDINTLNLLRTLKGHSKDVKSVAISSDSQTLISGSEDETIKVWNINTGTLLHTLEGHSEGVTSVAISSDGQTLISGSWDKTIKVWDIKTGSLLRTLEGHSYPVLSVAISRDGQTFISGSVDKTIKVWGVGQKEL